MATTNVTIGRIYRTPWEPSGLFRVTDIEPATGSFDESARGVFVGNHPSGYADGEIGRYFTKELAGREVDDDEEEDDIPPCLTTPLKESE